MMGRMTTSERAASFDQWYASMSLSDIYDSIGKQLLGLPPRLESNSLLPWDGIADVTAALALRTGDVLVDLACGRGGYGLEVASRTGAKLIGVDFSAVAIARALEKAGANADFRVGDLAATGLPDGVANGVMCVDAMQFADPYQGGIGECRRVLAPGGRLVITRWEPIDETGAELMPERLRHDIGQALRDGGFADVVVTEMPAWHEMERRHWQHAVTIQPDGDEALESMRSDLDGRTPSNLG